MGATNNELEKVINDKMEMTYNPSDVEEAEQTKDMVQDKGQQTLADKEEELEVVEENKELEPNSTSSSHFHASEA